MVRHRGGPAWAPGGECVHRRHARRMRAAVHLKWRLACPHSVDFPRPAAAGGGCKGGYGGRFAASMTLEILHGALVLLGRRPRLERAEITAAAGFLVDFARIEAIAA